MKIYNYISMLFLAGAAIVASCSQNEELTGETPDSLQVFQISVSDEGILRSVEGAAFLSAGAVGVAKLGKNAWLKEQSKGTA